MFRAFYKILFINIPLFVFADSQGSLYYTCNSANESALCTIYAKTNNGKNIVVMSKVSQGMIDYKGNIKTLSPSLGEVLFFCGTQCDAVTFVNLDTGIVSQKFANILAVDANNSLVAYPSQNYKENAIIIANIFQTQNRMTIKRDFSNGTIYNGGATVTFLDDQKAINLDYVIGPNFDEKTEIIPIDYNQLGLSNS